jgi:hypothetical protein
MTVSIGFHFTALVTCLAILFYFFTTIQVSKARAAFGGALALRPALRSFSGWARRARPSGASFMHEGW